MHLASRRVAVISLLAAIQLVSAVPCISNQDCSTVYGGPFVCSAGVCTVRDQCYAGYLASSDGTTCSPSSATVPCPDDQLCPYVAVGGQSSCVYRGTPVTGICSVQCFSGYFLQAGTCYPNPGATSIDICPIGQTCPKPPGNSTTICNSVGACDFACNPFYSRQGSVCVRDPCDPLKCPSSTNSQAICTNNQCDVLCQNGAVKSSNGTCICTKPSGCFPTGYPSCGGQCATVPGGSFQCNQTSQTCFAPTGCYGGFIFGDLNLTTCIPSPTGNQLCSQTSDCAQPFSNTSGSAVCTPKTGTGFAGICTLTCNAGYTKKNNLCLPNAGTVIKTCPNGITCPTAPGNSTTICNNAGACDFTCKSGFVKTGQSCVFNSTVITPPPPANTTCDPLNCPTSTYGIPICTSNKCDFTCNAGATKVNGICASTSTSCVKQPIAFYLDYHSTANGQPAITVKSIVDCASACVAQNCSSFDFWNGNQCGIQLRSQGTSFQGYQPSVGTIHGVPGSCSNYTQPGYCWNDSFCASDSVAVPGRRQRMSRKRSSRS